MGTRPGRSKTQPAPATVIWETLTQPRRATARQWLELAADEIEPRVIEAERPRRVVWSSLWTDRPNDRIVFEIEPAGEGSRLTWSLDMSEPALGADRWDAIRHRINYLINGEMRLSFGQ